MVCFLGNIEDESPSISPRLYLRRDTTMKITKLLVLGALGATVLGAPVAPVFAKTAIAGAHKGNGMAKQLGLSPDQKSQLKPIRQSAREQIKAIKADTTLSKSERKARIQAVRADAMSKVNAVLTPAQQTQLAQLRADRKAARRAAKGKA